MVEVFDNVNIFEHTYLQVLRSTATCKARKDELLESILLDHNRALYTHIEKHGIHPACSIKNAQKARALALLIIDKDGKLVRTTISRAKNILHDNLYHLGLGAQEDRKRDTHLLRSLEFLETSTEAQLCIKKISRPLSNRLAECAIRDTLLIPEKEAITDAHARQAVLMALLTTLRQSLGSCFATAPAIIIHEEQPLLFLKNLDELIGTAKLTRVVAGNEYNVPMSSSWGEGDLKKPIVITLPFEESVRSICPILEHILTTLKIILDSTKKIEEILKNVLYMHLNQGRWFLTTMEEILTKFFQYHLHISDKELKEYLEKPKAMLQTSLLMTATVTTNSIKNKEIQQLFALLNEGKRIFKASTDCALLKTWEFTLASFSEVKFDFCRWNFYSSLGINWDDIGGVGQVLYEITKYRIDETNQELAENKEKYESISIEVEYLKRRLQQASSESEIQWMKMEYQSRQAEQHHIQQICDLITGKANKIAQLHQFLIDQYDKLLREYFQEIYDADLHDVQTGSFDDSPAGFRLIYKYGRTNPSLWSKITSLNEYVEALVSFFTITEQELLHYPEIQGIEVEFSTIITHLANHVRSDEFLESAFARTARAHGVQPVYRPLLNLDKIEKKPWVYTSGGSMNTLVQSYFGVEGTLEVLERWVDNETELCAFLIDTTRQARQRSGRDHPKYLLTHSPTHAFLLLFNEPLFKKSWDCDTYSYSWIKNNITDPCQSFYSTAVLHKKEVEVFCSSLAEKLPKNIRQRFINESSTIPGFIRSNELAKEIQTLFSLDFTLKEYTSVLQEISLASLLFESIPYIYPEDVLEYSYAILKESLPDEVKQKITLERLRDYIPNISTPVASKDFVTLMKTLYIRCTGHIYYQEDALQKIISSMRQKKLLAPAPLIFADSNWIQDFFAFVVSPVSNELELWSVQAYGIQGSPITHWKQWVNGSRKDKTWGILTNPTQYKKE